MSKRLEVLDDFNDWMEETADTTANLTIESKMVLFCRQENLPTNSSIALGEGVIYTLAAMFAEYWDPEEQGLEEALTSFCQVNHLSTSMCEKFVGDLVEASSEDDDAGQDDDGEELPTDELEAQCRSFLDAILSAIPQTLGNGYIDLRQRLAPQLYGNDAFSASSYKASQSDPRNKHFGHTIQSQQRDLKDPALRRSVYSSSAVTALPEGEELDEHWHKHSSVGDYDIHQGAGIHGGMFAAREKGRGGLRDLHTFSGKDALLAAKEHAEISTAAKYQALGEDTDVNMYLDQPSGDAGDKSLWNHQQLNHGSYSTGIPDGTSDKNQTALHAKLREGVKMPHSALEHATSFAVLHGFAENLKVAKVEGNFVSILCATEQQADAIAEACGELFGRLTVSRFSLAEPEPDTSLYNRSELAMGLEAKPTRSAKRKMTEAIKLMSKSRPNTADIVGQALKDRIETEQLKSRTQHPDEGAGERQFNLR